MSGNSFSIDCCNRSSEFWQKFIKDFHRYVSRDTAGLLSFLKTLEYSVISQVRMIARIFCQFGPHSGREGVNIKREYSWLIALKNSQILFDDSKAVRLSSTCLGRVKVEASLSPGRAAIDFTCFSQELFLVATRLVCFSRKLVDASLCLTLTTFFRSVFPSRSLIDSCGADLPIKIGDFECSGGAIMVKVEVNKEVEPIHHI